MDKYGYYGMGDYKSKDWFIYDHKSNRLLSGYKFKTRKEAKLQAEILNKEKNKEK